MQAKRLWLALLCALVPSGAMAGVVDGGNAFVAHAESGMPFGSAQPAPSAPPKMPSMPVGGGDEDNPPFVPPGAPGAGATGFSPAPAAGATALGPAPATPAGATGFGPAPARNTPDNGLDGYRPFPNAGPGRKTLPPPLPTQTRANNYALAHGMPAKLPANLPSPTPIAPPSEVLKSSYIPKNAERARTREIVVGADTLDNVVVNMSGFAPNILVTPFHHPILIYTEKDAVQWSPYGDRMIISVNPNHPAGVVVTGKEKGDPTISMTLVPQKTIGRNYQLVIDDWTPNPVAVSESLPESQRNAHFLEIMKAAALGQSPDGYARSRRLPDGQTTDGIRITPYARYDGSRYALTEYRIRNLGSGKARLVESNFYRKGVVAVTFWPGGTLYGHGATRLFILTRLTRSTHAGLLGFVGKE